MFHSVIVVPVVVYYPEVHYTEDKLNNSTFYTEIVQFDVHFDFEVLIITAVDDVLDFIVCVRACVRACVCVCVRVISY